VERRAALDPWEIMAWLLPAGGALLATLFTNDLAYLIAVGDRIVDTGSLPRHDHLTYTVAGQPWVAQQWAAAIAFSRLHAWGSWEGLVLVRAALVGLCFGPTYRRTRSSVGDPLVAGVLVLGGFVCVASLPGALALRPQLLVAPLFVLSCWLVATRDRHPRRVWWVVAIAIAWANLHGSVLLVPLVTAIALVGDVARRRPTARTMAAITVAGLAAPLATPWGPRTYGYLWDVATSSVVRTIDEWRPIVERWPAGVVVGLAVVALGVSLWRRRRRPIDLETGLGLAVFTLLVIVSGRNVVWWALYVPPVAGAVLAGWHPSTARSRRAGPVVLAAMIALVSIGVWRVATAPSDEALLEDAPAGVTEALAAVAGGGRVFAANWAGWFEYAVPGTPMFVDPRAELFPEDVWDQYFEVVTASSSWEAVLDRWDVGVVVVDPDEHEELAVTIAGAPGWRLAYEDDDGRIYVRA
jgi:hypothetical protein